MSINDDLFDRFEALTFDDVVVIPGFSETLARRGRYERDVRRRHRTGRAPRVAAMDKVTEGGWPSPWPATAASA